MNPLNSSELYDEAVKVLYDVVYDACKSQPQRTEFMLKPQPNHDFSNQIAKKNVKKLLDLIAKHTQEARLDEKQTVELTQSKLDLEGVQLTVSVRIGDWVKRVAVSPVDYEVFKNDYYIRRTHQEIIKDIEYRIATLKPKNWR